MGAKFYLKSNKDVVVEQLDDGKMLRTGDGEAMTMGSLNVKYFEQSPEWVAIEESSSEQRAVHLQEGPTGPVSQEQ